MQARLQVAVSEFRCSFSCPYNSQSLLLSSHYCDGNCTPTAVIASGEGQLSDISFMGPALADHSYVDLSTVGSELDNSDSVVCHSDLSTCCSGGQGPHRGNWYFPDGTKLPFSGASVPIGLGRGAQIAIIRRTSGSGPTGIYRCRIATNAVHSDTDQSLGECRYCCYWFW